MARVQSSDPPNNWWNPLPYLSDTADKEAQRLNFVWKQLMDPCDAPITVWAWAFWPAFKHLVLAWYAIDIKQIVRTAVRPKFRAFSLRGRSHFGGREKGKRPGGKGGKFNPLEFDPSGWIGDQLNPYDEWPGFGPAPGELWVWSIIDIFERVAYYWMVLDLGSEFLYEWASGVASSSYCHARDDAVLLATAPGYPLLGIFGWDAMGILNAVKMRHIAFFNGFGAAADFGPGTVLATCHGENLDGFPGAYIEIRVRCLTGPRAGYLNMLHQDVEPFGSADMAISVDFNGGEVWIGEIKVNGGWQIHNPTLHMHATAKQPPK